MPRALGQVLTSVTASSSLRKMDHVPILFHLTLLFNRLTGYFLLNHSRIFFVGDAKITCLCKFSMEEIDEIIAHHEK